MWTLFILCILILMSVGLFNEVFGEELCNLGNMFFIEPLEYLSFVYLMEKANIVLTDSGGIQEEAPSLCKTLLGNARYNRTSRST